MAREHEDEYNLQWNYYTIIAVDLLDLNKILCMAIRNRSVFIIRQVTDSQRLWAPGSGTSNLPMTGPPLEIWFGSINLAIWVIYGVHVA